MKPWRGPLTLLGLVLVLTAGTLSGNTLPAAAQPSSTPVQILQAGADLGVRDGYPGVIGLTRDGNDTWTVSAGVASRFAAGPAQASAPFRIGSNTKSFVATVLLQLAGEGLLSLDDTVATWLPDAISAGGYDGTRITIRQLLNHTSGLPEYFGDARVSGPYWFNLDPYQPWPPQTLVDIALEHPAPAEPGQRHVYTNTNYVLAGMVIQAVTGNDPAVEIRQRIIEPLGLTDTTFPTADPTMPAGSLGGHDWVGGLGIVIRDVTVSNVQTYGAAGAMVSTLHDMATFYRALFAGELLRPAQLAELKTTVPLGDGSDAGYGLGVAVVHRECGDVWTHIGATLGYYSTWLTSEDGERQVVVAANENHLLQGTRGQQDVSAAAFEAFCAL